MSALPKYVLLDALEIEGGMSIFRPKGERFFHVTFRIAGRLYNRSTGKEDFSSATEAGKQIFADVVNPRSKTPGIDVAALEAKIDLLTAMVQNLAGSVKPTVSIKPILLSVVISEFVAQKSKEVGSHQGRDLKSRVTSLAEHTGDILVGDVTPTHIDGWLRSNPDRSHRTNKNLLNTIRSFFAWCCNPARHYLAANPTDGLKPPGKKRRKAIGVVDAKTAESLLRYIEKNHREYVCFYAITLFSGARADKDDGETLRLLKSVAKNGWAAHFVKANLLRIPEGKVEGEPRDAYLPPNLKAWLEAYPDSLEVPHRCWHTIHVSKPHKLPSNYARHTAASNYVANGGSLGTAAILFGNSERILRRDYVDLVEPAEAKKFYAIFPKRADETVAT